MDKIAVGEIEGYPVYFIPSRELLFCKNTIVPFKRMQEILHSDTSRHTIEEKNLTITKLAGFITLGCLTTSINNLEQIERDILKWEITNL